MSEKLTQEIYNESQINSIKFARYYYGRSNRPLINTLYTLQSMMNYVEQFDSTTLNEISWYFSNTSSLSILEEQYPEQYQTLLLYSPIIQLAKLFINNSAFDHIHFICQNGIGFEASNSTYNISWYDDVIEICQAYDDCSTLIADYSFQIAFPTLDLSNEVWKIRGGQQNQECLIQAQKQRILPISNSNDQIIYSLLTNDSVKIIQSGQMTQATLESAFMLWSNQTEEFTTNLYALIAEPITKRQWKMTYDGMGIQRVAFFSSYYFTHPDYPNVELNEGLLKECSMIYMQSMDLSYYLLLSGQNTDATQQLINQIGVACALHVVLILYFWRKGVVIALSLEVPINQLIKITKVDMKYLEAQEFNLESYQQFFNNRETKKFYEVIINYLNNIKYSNNKLLQDNGEMDEAEILIILSMSKQFYKKYNNMAAVGICANNIAKIHMKNQRYLEAMNEQEESVLIANQHLQSLKEMEKYKTQAAQPQDSYQLTKLYIRIKNNVLSQFERQDENMMKNLEKKVIFTTTASARRQTQTKMKNYETTQLKSSMDSEMNFQRQTTPRTTNWLKSRVQEERNIIREENSEPPSERLDNAASPPQQSIQPSHQMLNDDFAKQQLILEHKIVFRKYSLACILFNYSMKTIQSTFLNESVKQFEDIMEELQNLPESFSTQYLRVNILTKKVFCYIRAGMIEKSRLSLDEATTLFQQLENSKTIKQLDISEFVDIFREIPLDILKEKLNGLEALLLMIKGEYIQASYKFVSILQAQGYYDPGFQKFVLQTLSRIFKRCKLDKECLLKFYQQIQAKRLELIFLLDYSSEMTTEQFTLSHSMCQYVINQLNDDTQVGLYAFNESLHEIFPLQMKGTYKKLIESTFEKVLVKPGGQGNIFQALEITIAYLFDKDKADLRKQLQQHLQSNQLKQQILEQDEFRGSQQEFRCKISTPKITKTYSQGFSQALKQQVEEQYEEGSLNENMNQFKVDIDNIDEEKDQHSQKYVCIFSEGVHNYNQMSVNRLRSLIERKNVHLLIFNIANQNMNMLYLKQLSQVSQESKFFTNGNEMEQFFTQLRRNNFTKRVYFEFF